MMLRTVVCGRRSDIEDIGEALSPSGGADSTILRSPRSRLDRDGCAPDAWSSERGYPPGPHHSPSHCGACYVSRAYGSRLSSIAVPEALGACRKSEQLPIIYRGRGGFRRGTIER
jgi:hypothetical protein